MATETYKSHYRGYEIDTLLDKVSALTPDDYAKKTDISDFMTESEVDQKIEEAAYELPTATPDTLGGVKVDNTTVSIDEDGKLHAAEPDMKTISYEKIISKDNYYPYDSKDEYLPSAFSTTKDLSVFSINEKTRVITVGGSSTMTMGFRLQENPLGIISIPQNLRVVTTGGSGMWVLSDKSYYTIYVNGKSISVKFGEDISKYFIVKDGEHDEILIKIGNITYVPYNDSCMSIPINALNTFMRQNYFSKFMINIRYNPLTIYHFSHLEKYIEPTDKAYASDDMFANIKLQAPYGWFPFYIINNEKVNLDEDTNSFTIELKSNNFSDIFIDVYNVGDEYDVLDIESLVKYLKDIGTRYSVNENSLGATYAKIHGFEENTIVFNSDGSITQTFKDYEITTNFIDNVVIKRMYKNRRFYAEKVTKFNNDGSITERVDGDYE